jgi:holo-[acyl-carrier protein] synthase
MPVLSHGVDLVETARIARMLTDHPDRFLARCFTAAERAYCDRNTVRRAEHYAARFAAKEAVLKALGTGWAGGIAWTDIEVTRADSGAPGITLTGEAARIADSAGIARWVVSLSHAGGPSGYALASVLALGAE